MKMLTRGRVRPRAFLPKPSVCICTVEPTIPASFKECEKNEVLYRLWVALQVGRALMGAVRPKVGGR